MKLTKYTRQEIARAATAFAYDSKEKELRSAEDALAREAYATLFPEREIKAVLALPKNWIRFDECLQFNVGGQRLHLYTEKDKGLPVPYRIGDYAGYSSKTLGTIGHGDLCDRIQAHAGTVEKTKRARSDSYRKVLALTESVTTIKRLREIWPEGEQFYGKYANAPAVNLPAVQVAELNAELGLAA